MIIEINKDLINHYIVLIQNTIKTIISQFHRKPHNFLNEHDFHHYYHHTFYGKKGFSMQYLTRDGFQKNILHPEYPTSKRFKQKLIAVDLKCTRVRYDITIHGAVQ